MLLVSTLDAKGRAEAGRGHAMQGAPPVGISAQADMGLFRRLQHNNSDIYRFPAHDELGTCETSLQHV